LMAALAVLTGRGEQALAYMRTSRAGQMTKVPAVLTPSALPLFVFSALGGPRDSLQAYEERLSELIDGALPAEERLRARYDWMLRSAYVSLPTHRFQHLKIPTKGNYILTAAAHLEQREVQRVAEVLQPTREERKDFPPAYLTIDLIYPEAWLLATAQQPALAEEWLDPMLANMHAWPPFYRAGELVEVGAWVRAMALRAEIAAQLNDKPTARLWARPVELLWSDSDKPLRATVRQMHALAN
jgi:hypothetical protein